MPFPLLPLIGLAIQAAPDIARWLGGKDAEQVTAKVADTAKSIFGTDDPLAIEKKIAEDRALFVKWQLGLAAINRESEEADYKDRQSARINYGGSAKNVADKLAVLTVVMFGVVNSLALFGAGYLLFKGVKVNGNADIIIAIATFFGTVLGWVNSKTDIVYNFFFGSSRGSEQKTEAMNNAVNKLVKQSITR